MRRIIPRNKSANIYGRPKPNINNLIGNDLDINKEMAQQDSIIQLLLRQIKEISEENEILRRQRPDDQEMLQEKAPRGIG